MPRQHPVRRSVSAPDGNVVQPIGMQPTIQHFSRQNKRLLWAARIDRNTVVCKGFGQSSEGCAAAPAGVDEQIIQIDAIDGSRNICR
jgi:hypothetical protein